MVTWVPFASRYNAGNNHDAQEILKGIQIFAHSLLASHNFAFSFLSFLHIHILYLTFSFLSYIFIIFRGLRPEAGNAGSRGDLSHILSFVAHTCARLSPLQKLDLLKKRERERERCIYIYLYIIIEG